MIIQGLRNVYARNQNKGLVYVRNFLKESLQYYILNYVYNSSYSESFVFKGGTALRFCFGLPRLSEDLDFDVKDFKNFNFEEFRQDLLNYFSRKLQFRKIDIQIKGQNNLIYVRFPVLKEIGYPIDKPSENVLFVRIDLAEIRGSKYKTDISLRSSYDFSFLIRRYSLSDLFTGKVAAILQRETKENGNVVARFKGRDYFDLFWLNEKNVQPNYDYLKEITSYNNKKEVVKNLQKKIEIAAKKKQYLKNDLYPFFENKEFVDTFIDNLESLKDKIAKW